MEGCGLHILLGDGDCGNWDLKAPDSVHLRSSQVPERHPLAHGRSVPNTAGFGIPVPRSMPHPCAAPKPLS
jgi:hypothetical protein